MTAIDGNTLDGVSATTLWTLHNRGTEAKRSDGVIRDPWAVTLFDAISYDYRKFGKPNQSHGLRAVAFDTRNGRVLAQNLETQLMLFDLTGTKRGEYKVTVRGDEPRQFLVYPDGSKAILLLRSVLLCVDLPPR